MPLLWSTPVDPDHPPSFVATALFVVFWSVVFGVIAGYLVRIAI